MYLLFLLTYLFFAVPVDDDDDNK